MINKIYNIYKIHIILMLLAASACGHESWRDLQKRESDNADESPLSPNLGVAGNLSNFAEIVSAEGLNPIYQITPRSAAAPKIAIFDNGFSGLADVLGQSLPPELVIQPFPKTETTGHHSRHSHC